MKKNAGFIALFIILAALSFAICFSIYNRNKASEPIKKIFGQNAKIAKISLKNLYKEDFIKADSNKITGAWEVYDNNFESKKTGLGMIVKTQGYNGDINVAVGIDIKTNKVLGIDIVSQKETPHYGNYIVEKWFTDRFINKNAEAFLNLKALEASDDQDIIQVTGATMSSKAVVDAVNTAICAYNYIELDKTDAAKLYSLVINSIKGHSPTEQKIAVDRLRNMEMVNREALRRMLDNKQLL
jgi:RnfABCDGE-type electron transport complex G subunit